jgi:hypothetical protein
MVYTQKKKQAVVAASNPLEDAGILLQVFAFLPGHYLFIGAVCREWRGLYVGAADQHFEVRRLANTLRKKLVTCDFKTTLCSAAVASPATASLACENGLQMSSYKIDVQWIAGLHADLDTLATLRELGMPLSGVVIQAVAFSGRLAVLQQLLSNQHCPRPPDLSQNAAQSGNISMLKWLRAESWCVLDEKACAAAARAGQLATLQYLCSIGCKLRGDRTAIDAAIGGSIEVVDWLQQQQGIVFDKAAMAMAAGKGQTALCQHLFSIGCELHHFACLQAVVGGAMDTLRWLRDNGCPWNVNEVCEDAARKGNTNILDYVIEQGEVLDAELLTDALNNAAANNQLQTAQWLRQHGAQWPAVLSYGLFPLKCQWSGDVLAWARAEGCTSPMSVAGNDNDSDNDTDNEA